MFVFPCLVATGLFILQHEQGLLWDCVGLNCAHQGPAQGTEKTQSALYKASWMRDRGFERNIYTECEGLLTI